MVVQYPLLLPEGYFTAPRCRYTLQKTRHRLGVVDEVWVRVGVRVRVWVGVRAVVRARVGVWVRVWVKVRIGVWVEVGVWVGGKG